MRKSVLEENKYNLVVMKIEYSNVQTKTNENNKVCLKSNEITVVEETNADTPKAVVAKDATMNGNENLPTYIQVKENINEDVRINKNSNETRYNDEKQTEDKQTIKLKTEENNETKSFAITETTLHHSVVSVNKVHKKPENNNDDMITVYIK